MPMAHRHLHGVNLSGESPHWTCGSLPPLVGQAFPYVGFRFDFASAYSPPPHELLLRRRHFLQLAPPPPALLLILPLLLLLLLLSIILVALATTAVVIVPTIIPTRTPTTPITTRCTISSSTIGTISTSVPSPPISVGLPTLRPTTATAIIALVASICCHTFESRIVASNLVRATRILQLQSE